MDNNFILSDFLTELKVPHTADYTNRRFAKMSFMSLFGLSKLLQEYGVESEGLRLANKSDISRITPPFLAHTCSGFVIVKSVDPNNVVYLSQGERETMPKRDFERASDGLVFLAYPSKTSREPDYAAHRRMNFLKKSKTWLLAILLIALLAYVVITSGVWHHITLIFVMLLDFCGLFFSYLLMQKTVNVKSKTADRVCAVLQKGGCDEVLSTKASSFFGLFKWSEVGFAYFSVSLLALLLFPQSVPWLAACNILCLPYTIWSITYQKFVAKAWCTMCVSVQCILWLLFFSFLGGGWLKEIFPIKIGFFVLGAVYVAALLLINKVSPHLDRSQDA